MKKLAKFIAYVVAFVVVLVVLVLLADATILIRPDYPGNSSTITKLVQLDFNSQKDARDSSIYLLGQDCAGYFVSFPLQGPDCFAYSRFENGNLVLGVNYDPDLDNKPKAPCPDCVAPVNYHNAYLVLNNHGQPFVVPSDKWLVVTASVTFSDQHLGTWGNWFQPAYSFDKQGRIIYADKITGTGLGYVGEGPFSGSTVNYFSVGDTVLERNFNFALSLLKMKPMRDVTAHKGVYNVAITKSTFDYIVCVLIVTEDASQQRCIHTPTFPSDQVDVQFWSDNATYTMNKVNTTQYVAFDSIKVYTIDK